MIAIIQATETVKLLTGVGTSLVGRLLAYDALAMEWNEFRLTKDAECPVCGSEPTITELIDYQGFCGFGPPGDEAPPVAQVRATDLAARLAGTEELLLLDVREPEECVRASIAGARAIPLAQIEARVTEIEAWRERPVVVHCHHGGRSAQACEALMRLGFQRVENLDGGIEAWSLTVDGAVPRY